VKGRKWFETWLLGIGVLLIVTSGSADVIEQARRVNQLRQDISLLNLVNGLNLSADQRAGLIAILRGEQAERAQFEAQLEAVYAEVEEAFAALREALLGGPNVPPQVQRRAVQAEHRLKELQEQWKERRAVWEERVVALLNENQLLLVAEFAPCLVPPKRRDESPVGQIPAEKERASQAARLLSRIRALPEEVFAARGEELAERGLRWLLKDRGELNPTYREAVLRNIKEVMEEARRLSEVEFELQKEQLVQRLMPLQRSRSASASSPRREKVGRFLLDLRLLPLLEAQQALMTKGEEP